MCLCKGGGAVPVAAQNVCFKVAGLQSSMCPHHGENGIAAEGSFPYLSIHQNLLVWTGRRERVVMLPDAAAPFY